MVGRKYERQKEVTPEEVWEKARSQALSNHNHPTKEEFVDEMKSRIKASGLCVERHIPTKTDDERDEIYYSRSKVPIIGNSEDRVWFETECEDTVVKSRLSVFLRAFDVNLGLVDSKQAENENMRYEIKIPFISREKRRKRIRRETLDIVREKREYKMVDEDDVVGDCQLDSCDGERYRSGMGSRGPRYRCTRYECNFVFERDVL